MGKLKMHTRRNLARKRAEDRRLFQERVSAKAPGRARVRASAAVPIPDWELKR